MNQQPHLPLFYAEGTMCSLCDMEMDDHCGLHATPCCPGKCPGVEPIEPAAVHPLVRAIQLRLIAHPLTGYPDLGDIERGILLDCALVIEQMSFTLDAHPEWSEP